MRLPTPAAGIKPHTVVLLPGDGYGSCVSRDGVGLRLGTGCMRGRENAGNRALEIPRTVHGGVTGKRPLTCSPANEPALVVAQIEGSQNVRRFIRHYHFDPRL